MSPLTTRFPEVEAVDEKVAQQLESIATMCGRGNRSLLGVVGRYYTILCAEASGEIPPLRRHIEVQKLLRDIPPEMKDDVDCAIARVSKLPLRRVPYVPIS